MSALGDIAREQAAALVDDANWLGELLRSWAFVGEGYGCYETFDVRPGFVEVTPTPREFELLWGRKFNPNDTDKNDWGYCDTDTIKQISWFKHPNGIEVGWYWDGDGTLGFFVPELVSRKCSGAIHNTDCKKDYEWSFVPVHSSGLTV